MKIRRFSIAAHLLHSRLQLVRNKLEAKKDMKPIELVDWNMKIFERAGESVQKQHEIRCGKTEHIDAAELFLLAFDADDQDIKNQPMWRK
jgi:hypothetical protein